MQIDAFARTQVAHVEIPWNNSREIAIFSRHWRVGAKSGRGRGSFQTVLERLHEDGSPEEEAPPVDCQTRRIKPRVLAANVPTSRSHSAASAAVLLARIFRREESYGSLKKIDLNLRQDNKGA